jgi:hypothetical protein
MSQIDPLLPFEIDPVNGREAPESGLRLKAAGCARSGRTGDAPNAISLCNSAILPASAA